MVPDRADTWTRWSYAGPNQPVAPISDPYQMFNKLYGQNQNRAMLASVWMTSREDFKKIEKLVSPEDRQMLQQHVDMVRSVEVELQSELQHSRKRTTSRSRRPRAATQRRRWTTTTCRS